MTKINQCETAVKNSRYINDNVSSPLIVTRLPTPLSLLSFCVSGVDLAKINELQDIYNQHFSGERDFCWHLAHYYFLLGIHIRRECLAQKNIRKYSVCKQISVVTTCSVQVLGTRYSSEDGKQQSSEEFQEVSEVLCEQQLLTYPGRSICPTCLHQCIHRFFLNLSDSFSFALLSSDAVSLCSRFRSLAQSCLDCSCSISALARSFSHLDCLLVGPIPRGQQDETTEIAPTQLKCDGYIYMYTRLKKH